MPRHATPVPPPVVSVKSHTATVASFEPAIEGNAPLCVGVDVTLKLLLSTAATVVMGAPVLSKRRANTSHESVHVLRNDTVQLKSLVTAAWCPPASKSVLRN